MILLVCSVVHRTALGARGRGRPGNRDDRRRQSERVYSLMARQTDPATNQPQEETCIRCSTRDRSPKSRDIIRSCMYVLDGFKKLQLKSNLLTP